MSKIGRCGGCLREWSPLGQAHCATCHEQFNSTAAFDRHRRDFECVSVAEFGKPHGKAAKPLLVRVERSEGPVWATAAYELGKRPERVSQWRRMEMLL